QRGRPQRLACHCAFLALDMDAPTNAPFIYLNGTSLPSDALADFTATAPSQGAPVYTGSALRAAELPVLAVPQEAVATQRVAEPSSAPANKAAAAAYPTGPRRVVYSYMDAYRFNRQLSPDDLVFTSHFEGGNLLTAARVLPSDSGVALAPPPGAGGGDAPPVEYDLFMAPDIHSPSHRQWFCFAVSNMAPGQPYRFHIANHAKTRSLYGSAGMTPLLFSFAEWRDPTSRRGWHRLTSRAGDPCIGYFRAPPPSTLPQDASHMGSARSHILSFTVTFSHPRDVAVVAMAWPYGYAQHMAHLSALQRRAGSCLTRSTLTRTLAGNVCDILTIADKGRTLLPLGRRQALVFSARVHPGEANASWVMRGLLEAVTGPTPSARWIRRHYVTYVVPMLNPDGVINGHHRTNLAGLDLNRQWAEPSRERSPTVWHLRALLLSLARQRRGPVLFTDFHGHSRRRNVFMFGGSCAAGDASRLLPLLLARLAPDFSMEGCSFALSAAKAGTARGAMFAALPSATSYTIEASFAGASGGARAHEHFTPLSLEETGAHFVAALHDLVCLWKQRPVAAWAAGVHALLHRSKALAAAGLPWPVVLRAPAEEAAATAWANVLRWGGRAVTPSGAKREGGADTEPVNAARLARWRFQWRLLRAAAAPGARLSEEAAAVARVYKEHADAHPDKFPCDTFRSLQVQAEQGTPRDPEALPEKDLPGDPAASSERESHRAVAVCERAPLPRPRRTPPVPDWRHAHRPAAFLLLALQMSGAVMTTVAWMLRASVAATFAGHGALAFGVNDKWLKYMSVAGFSASTSRQLMPVIGVVDMVVAALALWPSVDPALFAWAALWGISTALMRPLAGEGVL
ncbi:agtpbp1, partial [Symbiodinium sp. KB8]